MRNVLMSAAMIATAAIGCSKSKETAPAPSAKAAPTEGAATGGAAAGSGGGPRFKLESGQQLAQVTGKNPVVWNSSQGDVELALVDRTADASEAVLIAAMADGTAELGTIAHPDGSRCYLAGGKEPAVACATMMADVDTLWTITAHQVTWSESFGQAGWGLSFDGMSTEVLPAWLPPALLKDARAWKKDAGDAPAADAPAGNAVLGEEGKTLSWTAPDGSRHELAVSIRGEEGSDLYLMDRTGGKKIVVVKSENGTGEVTGSMEVAGNEISLHEYWSAGRAGSRTTYHLGWNASKRRIVVKSQESEELDDERGPHFDE